MNILIDTNVVIPLEPTSPSHVEVTTGVAAELVRAVASGGHRLLLHPLSLAELARDKNASRQSTRAVLLRKYLRLDRPPGIQAGLEALIGRSRSGTHDWVDDQLLAATWANAVDFLVTGDERIHAKASRASLTDRVLTVEDALAFLRSLEGRTPLPPPAVEAIRAYELDEHDPIFDSFRADYPGFDTWLIQCKRDQRPAWVVREESQLAAVSIVKERDDELGLDGPTMKICSLKVAPERQGRRYGELLLKTLFQFAHENRYAFAFLTVHSHHVGLIALIEDFGFERSLPDRGNGELVYVKRFGFSEDDRNSLSPLEFHVRFGPPAVTLVDDQVFVVPIQPRFHRMLFPEAEAQQQLVSPHPFGNALRKAYLSNTGLRRIRPGATLLFYRSRDIHSVTCMGVVERTLASTDPTAVAAFVGQRTVYTLDDITDMCVQREVLAILFRQDRLLPTPIPVHELTSRGVVRRAPQSIATVPAEVLPWLAQRIGA